MSVEQQLQEAKVLIEQKKYDEATALLITVDHPTADKWLDRLNQMSASTSTQSNQSGTQFSGRTERRRRNSGSSGGSGRNPRYSRDSDKSFTVKLFVTIILLLFFAVPGIIALAIFAPEAKKYPDAEGAKALIWLNRIVFGIMIIIGVGMVLFIVIPALLMS